jgi:hypothetical protein
MPPVSNTYCIDQAFRFKIQLASYETCETKYQSLVNYHWELCLLVLPDFSGGMEGLVCRLNLWRMKLFKYMKVCHGVAGSRGVRNTLSSPHCRH